MKWKCLLFAVIGFFAANALMVWAVAAEQAHSLRSLEGPSFDTEFLREMIAHHQLGVQMAQIAVQNAERDEVKQFASDLAVNQQREIQEMQRLREGTGVDHAGSGAAGRAAPPGPNLDAVASPAQPDTGVAVTPPNVTQMAQTPEQGAELGIETNRDKLKALEAEDGKRFDALFVREMIAHHTTGLEIAQLARQKASAAAVKNLADTIGRSESEELRTLRQLQADLPR